MLFFKLKAQCDMWSRRRRLKHTDFSIISNNCWAGTAVYQPFGLKYNTPTVGLFFMDEDYICFFSSGFIGILISLLNLFLLKNPSIMIKFPITETEKSSIQLLCLEEMSKSIFSIIPIAKRPERSGSAERDV